MIAGLRLAVTLLTVLPMRSGTVDRESAGWAMTLAPAVGLVVGLVGAGVVLLGEALGFGGILVAALVLGAMALVTRGLHLDGLADLADGLGSGRPAAGALEVMRRSDIGPFGVLTLLFVLMIQVTALAQAPHRVVAVLVAVVAGRLAVTWACRPSVPAARPDGLGALVAGTVRLRDAVVVTVVVTVTAALGGLAVGGAHGAVSAVAAVGAGTAVTMVVGHHAVRRLGGISGDVLGALVEVATTTALVILVV